MRFLGYSLACLLAAGAPALGQVAFQSQERSISIQTAADGFTTAATATSFAPFVADLAHRVPTSVGGNPIVNIATAGISCHFDFTGVAATVRMGCGGGSGVAGTATVLIDVLFSTPDPLPYTLRLRRLTGDALGAHSGILQITNAQTNQPVYTHAITAGDPNAHAAGTFQPGVYRFYMQSTLVSEQSGGGREFDLDLGFAHCEADLDDGSGTGQMDNAVTIDDLLYFLPQFSAGNEAADVDDGTGMGERDGAVTIDDLLYFLTRFEAGC